MGSRASDIRAASAGWVHCLSSQIQIPVGGFTVSFALGEKALTEARASKLPEKVLRIMNEAKRYPEGTLVRIEMEAVGDVAIVKQLTAAKLKN